MFILPYRFNGTTNTTIGHLKGFLSHSLTSSLPLIAMLIIVFCSIATLWILYFRPKKIEESEFFSEMFLVTPFWLFSRLLGAVIAVMVYFKLGPEFVLREDIGGTLLFHVAPRVLVLSLVLGFTTPLLLDFGLVEYIGTFMRPIMRPFFNLPGRSAIDCLASWVGNGEVAVLLTVEMHEEGHYSDREAAVMATTFSVIGIPYTYAVADLVGLSDRFGLLLFAIYFTLALVAFIMPHVWPLCSIPETYSGKKGRHPLSEKIPHGYTLGRWSFLSAVYKAGQMSLKKYLHSVMHLSLSLLFCTLPLVIAWGATLLILNELTPVFKLIEIPFESLLNFAGVPEADQISTAIVLAFVDQFLGAVVGLQCETEAAKFFCAAISATTLISMTETGGHIWHSRIPIGFGTLLWLYLVRTLLSLVVLIPLTLLFFE